MCLFTLPIGITSRSSPPFWFVYALFLTFTRPAWPPFSSMADIHTRQYLRSVDLAGIEYDRRITTVRTVLPLDFPNLCLCYFTPFRLPTISNHSCPPRNVCSILSCHSDRWAAVASFSRCPHSGQQLSDFLIMFPHFGQLYTFTPFPITSDPTLISSLFVLTSGSFAVSRSRSALISSGVRPVSS